MAGVTGIKQQRAQIEADRVWQKKMYEKELEVRGKPNVPNLSDFEVWMSQMPPGTDPIQWMQLYRFSPPETPEQARARAKATAEGRIAGGEAGAEKPSDYDKKVANAKALRAKGMISDQELTRVLTGYSEGITPQQEKSLRNGIDLRTKIARSGLTAKYPKINKKNIDQIRQSDNLNPDMPVEYDIAKQRILGNVSDDKDVKLVSDYDEAKRFFIDNLMGKTTYADFLNSPTGALFKKKGLDIGTLKFWFDLYR
jgi:hypothetical protein